MTAKNINSFGMQWLWSSFAQSWREVLAEFIGTFILLFTGTGAIIVNDITKGAIGLVGICFVFGATVAALVYATGHLSGTHINPAVTLAFWTGGFFPQRRVLPYIVAQFAGAIVASTTLYLIFGKIGLMGATVPLDGNWRQCFGIEIFITFILMFVILGAALDRRANSSFAGLVIGLTVTLLAVFAGPISGASMNPARSFSPALIAGIWQDQWIYWIGPVIGAQLAVLCYQLMFRDESK